MSQQSFFKATQRTKLETLSHEELLHYAALAQQTIEYFKKENKTLRDFVSRYPEQEKLAIYDQLLIIRHKMFGRSSEKIKKEKPRKEKKEPVPKVCLPSERYPELTLVESEIEFEKDPQCSACDSSMVKMNQTENAEFITVVEKTYHINRQKRHKYKCQKCYGSIKTVPAPPRIKPGSGFSDDIAIDVAVSKYADHIPIERYVGQAKRAGLDGLYPQTLIDQTHYLADFLEPLYQKLKKEVEESIILHADETPWNLLEGSETKNWFMWGFFTLKSAYYSAENSRASIVASDFLKNCKAQFLASDAYSGYGKCTKGTSIKNSYCNAHARRKFVEAALNYPDASKIVELYGKLYEIEREIKTFSPDQKLTERTLRSRPVVDEIRLQLFSLDCLPKSSIGKARDYVLKYWDGLTLFLKDGRLNIDNNLSERGLRGIVLGRKNFYGNHSERGAKTTSRLYSIIESCKLNNIEPSRYLKNTVKAIHFGKDLLTPSEYAANNNIARAAA